MATRERTGTRTVNRSRRSVIKAGLAGLVAAGAGRVPIAEASAPAGQSPTTTAGIAPSARPVNTQGFDLPPEKRINNGIAQAVYPQGQQTPGGQRGPGAGNGRPAAGMGPVKPHVFRRAETNRDRRGENGSG